MNDRDALLSAIRANPAENTPRLVYADWLDEFGTTDLDRATAEFIRVSCPDRVRVTMPRAAYQWIADNWFRLVPTLLSKRTARREEFDRTGRFVHFHFQLAKQHVGLLGGKEVERPWLLRWKPIVVSCHRGFVESVQMWSELSWDLKPLVEADQPLARMACMSDTIDDPINVEVPDEAAA